MLNRPTYPQPDSPVQQNEVSRKTNAAKSNDDEDDDDDDDHYDFSYEQEEDTCPSEDEARPDVSPKKQKVANSPDWNRKGSKPATAAIVHTSPERQRTPEAQRSPERQRTPEAQRSPEAQRTPEAQGSRFYETTSPLPPLKVPQDPFAHNSFRFGGYNDMMLKPYPEVFRDFSEAFLTIMERDIKRAEDRSDETIRELRKQVWDMEILVRELQGTIKRMERESIHHMQQCRQNQEATTSKKMEADEFKILQLEETITDLVNQCNLWESRTHDAEKESDAAAAKIEALKTLWSSHQENSSTVDSEWRKKYESLHKEYSTATASHLEALNDERSKHKVALSDVRKLTAAHASDTDIIEKLNEKVSSYKKQLNSAQEELDKKTSTIEELMESLKQSEKSCTEIQDVADLLNKEIEVFQTKIEQNLANEDLLSCRFVEISKELQTAQSNVETTQRELLNLQKQYDGMYSDFKKLEALYNTALKQNTDLSDQVARYTQSLLSNEKKKSDEIRMARDV